MEDAINTEDYREDIVKELESRNLPADTVEFKDVADETAPYQPTRCFKIRKKIFLKKRIERDEKELIIGALAEKFPDEIELLEDDRNFVLQRIICEAYHIIYRYQIDYECNKLALYDVKNSAGAFHGRGESRH